MIKHREFKPHLKLCESKHTTNYTSLHGPTHLLIFYFFAFVLTSIVLSTFYVT